MYDMADTLLPQTATPLAKALDILEERLFGLPVASITKDPLKVDALLLDHLAWEMSVDVWDYSWPEATKRNVILQSSEVHRFKGTPYAIKMALSVFDVSSELREWWDPGGVANGMVPGSFRVIAFAGQSLYGDSASAIDYRMLSAMRSVVQRVAPVSRGFEFVLGESFSTAIHLRSSARQARRSEISHVPATRGHPVAPVATLTTGLSQRRVHRITSDAAIRTHAVTTPPNLRHGLRLTGVDRYTHDVLRSA